MIFTNGKRKFTPHSYSERALAKQIDTKAGIRQKKPNESQQQNQLTRRFHQWPNIWPKNYFKIYCFFNFIFSLSKFSISLKNKTECINFVRARDKMFKNENWISQEWNWAVSGGQFWFFFHFEFSWCVRTKAWKVVGVSARWLYISPVVFFICLCISFHNWHLSIFNKTKNDSTLHHITNKQKNEELHKFRFAANCIEKKSSMLFPSMGTTHILRVILSWMASCIHLSWQ